MSPEPEQPSQPEHGQGQRGQGQRGEGEYRPPYPGPEYGATPYPPGPPATWYGPGYIPAATTNPKAVAALAIGLGALLLSFCCGLGVVGVAAIVLGVMARNEVRNSGGRQQGDGFALTGIITGAVAVALSLIIVALLGIAFVTADGIDAPGETDTSQTTEL